MVVVRRFTAAIALLAALVSASVSADEISGRVVGVADGDTLTILTAEKQQVKVRLAQIDTPEKGQPYGQASKKSLSDLCFGKDAVLKVESTDRYGRAVARVGCDGIDANREQVRRGLAWAYLKYLTDRELLDVEAEARAGGRGLWADPDPVPPWEWRRR